MTIRDKLKSQMLKAQLVAFGFWLLFVAGNLLPTGTTYQALLFIPFIGFAGSVLYLLLLIKCPNCGARLGQAFSSLSKPNFCPVCGIAFDDQV
jgi:hypothetical protein